MARAPRLSPDDRRQAIVAATVPLLVEHGTEVSTRQIAAACGIAEGTLFRVFPNKEAIVSAAVHATLDPSDVIARLDAIDRGLPLAERLSAVVVTLQDGVRQISEVMAAILRPRTGTDGPHHGHGKRHHAKVAADQEAVTVVIASVLAPDAARLTVDPMTAASLVRTLVLAANHPMLADGRLADPHLIARLLLNAVTKDPS